jgi:hypothetical protein
MLTTRQADGGVYVAVSCRESSSRSRGRRLGQRRPGGRQLRLNHGIVVVVVVGIAYAAAVLQSYRPEDVRIGDELKGGETDDEQTRPAHGAQLDGAQREADGDEPIKRDEHDQPRAEVQTDDEQIHQDAARRVRQVEPLDAGDDPNPRLERRHVEYQRVGAGQRQQVGVDRRGPHALSHEHHAPTGRCR